MWVKANTSARDKVQMMLPNRQFAMAMTRRKADELAKSGATMDGAEFAKQTTKGADKVRQHAYDAIEYAATFRCELEDLVDMEASTDEMKQTPK